MLSVSGLVTKMRIEFPGFEGIKIFAVNRDNDLPYLIISLDVGKCFVLCDVAKIASGNHKVTRQRLETGIDQLLKISHIILLYWKTGVWQIVTGRDLLLKVQQECRDLASKIAKIAKMDGRKRFLASKIAKIAKMDDRCYTARKG